MREGNQNCGNITQYSTGYLQLASGNAAQRPTMLMNGMMRYNTDSSALEIYQGGTWTFYSGILASRVFYADQFDEPISSDWSVATNAPAMSDATYAAISVRAFSKSTEQGVGFMLSIPNNATAINLRLKGRAATAPSAAAAVQMRLHRRTITLNAAPSAWTITALNTVTIPTNAFYQSFVQTMSLTSLGLSPNTLVQFELTRQGSASADTLSGDFDLVEMAAEFT
jgi:hypothetical protein